MPPCGIWHRYAVIPLLSGLGAFDWSLWSLILELRFYLLIFACMFFIDTTEKSFHIAVAILGYDAVLQLAPLLGLPLPEWSNLFGTHGFGAYGPLFRGPEFCFTASIRVRSVGHGSRSP